MNRYYPTHSGKMVESPIGLYVDVRELEQENKKLREALIKVSTIWNGDGDGEVMNQALDSVWKTAIKALSKDKEEE